MELEEYREGLLKIDKAARKAKGELAFSYAMSNNPYKKGDIVEDHEIRIRIETADVRVNMAGVPTCVFRGPLIKKDGTPFKNNKIGEVWQTNIKK